MTSPADRAKVWFDARVAVLILLPAAVAAVTALEGRSAEHILGFASLAGIPLMAWAAVMAPEALVGAIVFAQILEQFELATPIGTVSPGSVALVVFLVVRLPDIIATVRKPGYMFATVLAIAYVAGHSVQFLHVAGDRHLGALGATHELGRQLLELDV